MSDSKNKSNLSKYITSFIFGFITGIVTNMIFRLKETNITTTHSSYNVLPTKEIITHHYHNNQQYDPATAIRIEMDRREGLC